ncbi:MAG: hypothetical protein ACE5FA_00880 [Dehalococcoidia bacterium]
MESFETLAEIAIGLAGFGTIAIVLSRDSRRWSSADFFRTAALFLSSLGALFLSLLPIGLATAALPDMLLWRISSAVMAVFIVVFSAILLDLRRKHLERALWFGPVLLATISISTVTNLCAQALNSTGFLFEPNATIAFFGIVWFLMYGCLMLVRIVFLPPGSQ